MAYYGYFNPPPTPDYSQLNSPWLRQQTEPTFPYMGGPQAQPDSTPDPSPSFQQEASTESPLTSLYRNILNRQQGPAQSAYSQFLQRGYPNEENYKPGKGRIIGSMITAGLLGAARDPRAYEKGQEIQDEPFNRAVKQYGLEGNRLNAASLEESRQTQDQIRTVSGMVNEERAQKLAEHQNRQDSVAESKAADLERHRQAQDDIARFKANHPTTRLFAQKGGNLYTYDAIRGLQDSGIKSGTLSDLDKINFQVEGDEALARVKGDEARKTKGTASGTQRRQLVQPLDENGKPSETPFILNLDTGEKEPVKDMKGFIKPPPKDTSAGVVETETTKETPPKEPSVMRKASDALGITTPEKPKVITTKTTRTPGKAKPTDAQLRQTVIDAIKKYNADPNNKDKRPLSEANILAGIAQLKGQ